MAHGDQEYMETILRVPVKLSPEQLVERERDFTRVGRFTVKAEPLPDEPYYVVTCFQNEGLKTSGVWRLHLIFDPGPKEGTRLLTVLDATHSTMLFTVVLPDDSGRAPMFKVVTPLQRVMQNQIGNGGLWAALEDADDDA